MPPAAAAANDASARPSLAQSMTASDASASPPSAPASASAARGRPRQWSHAHTATAPPTVVNLVTNAPRNVRTQAANSGAEGRKIEQGSRGERQRHAGRDGIDREADQPGVQREEQGHVARAAEAARVRTGTIEDPAGQVLRERSPHAARIVLRQGPRPVPEDQRERAGERDEARDPDEPPLRPRQRIHARITHSPRPGLSLASKREHRRWFPRRRNVTFEPGTALFAETAMRIARLLTPALVLAFLPTAGFTSASTADPPTRVGRLSFLRGAVSFRPAGGDDWADASLNYPLTTGDHIWSDDDGRAEVSLGSTAIRLARYTAVGFLDLDDHTSQLRLSPGSVQVRLRNLEEDDSFEIDTPNGAISLLRPGSYVVDVDSTGDTTIVTVRRGEAEVTAAGSSFSVRSDQAATLVGTDWPTYDVHDPLAPDEWEDWCASRDRRADNARSASYVSRDMPGYEDLDDYGDWRVTPTYGAVWVPRGVVGGWAPYRYGHWAWVEPWGWTWIDDAPRGFAPFHYGRWVYWQGGWGWVPGRAVAWRPV